MKWDVISEEYKQLLADKHAIKSWGGGGSFWAPFIAPMLNKYDNVTILDYGSGRGTFKPAMMRLRPDAIITEYDPGVPGIDEPPHDPVDFVLCTDVLEHIEPEKLDNVLGHIDWLMKGGCMLNIVFGASRSFLPDGRNTHILQRSQEWWLEKLNDPNRFHGVDWTIHEDKHKTGTRLFISGERDWSFLRDT